MGLQNYKGYHANSKEGYVEVSNNVDQDNNSNNNDDSQVKGLIRKTRK